MGSYSVYSFYPDLLMLSIAVAYLLAIYYPLTVDLSGSSVFSCLGSLH